MGLNSPSFCFTVTARITLVSILKGPLRRPQVITYKEEIHGRMEMVKSEKIFFIQKIPQACLKSSKVIQSYLSHC